MGQSTALVIRDSCHCPEGESWRINHEPLARNLVGQVGDHFERNANTVSSWDTGYPRPRHIVPAQGMPARRTVYISGWMPSGGRAVSTPHSRRVTP